MSFKKAVSTLVASLFLYSVLAADFARASSMPMPVSESIDILNSNDTGILKNYAKVTSVMDFGSDTTVINIQDFHMHPGVQQNISSIIGALAENYEIKNVYLEGAYDKVDTAWLSGIKNESLKKNLISKLTEDGKLTGAEIYSVAHDKNDFILGLEDRQIHRKNIQRFAEILDKKTQTLQELSKLEKELSFYQQKYLSSANKKFTRIVKKYSNGEIESGKFYKILLTYLKKYANPGDELYGALLPMAVEDYPNMMKYLKAQNLQNRINAKTLSYDLQVFADGLKGELSFSDYQKILSYTNNFADIDALISVVSVLPQEYKDRYATSQMQNFIEASRLYKEINPVELINEERDLIQQIRAILSKNKAELEVSFLTDFFKYFGDYMTAQISADDREYFSGKIDKFLNLWSKYSFYSKPMLDLAASLPAVNEYYNVNDLRNEIFVNRLSIKNEGRVKASGVEFNSFASLIDGKKLIVVITGGYHSKGLTELLAQKNISYAVITPNITGGVKNAYANYESTMKEQAQIFAQGLAALAGLEGLESRYLLTLIAQITAGNYNAEDINGLIANINAAGLKIDYKYDETKGEITISSGEDRIIVTDNKEVKINFKDKVKTGLVEESKVVEALKKAEELVKKALKITTLNGGTDIFAPEALGTLYSLETWLIKNGFMPAFSNGFIYEIERSKDKESILEGISKKLGIRQEDLAQKSPSVQRGMLLRYKQYLKDEKAGKEVKVAVYATEVLGDFRVTRKSGASTAASVEDIFGTDLKELSASSARKPMIAGNWKMNYGTTKEAREYIRDLMLAVSRSGIDTDKVDVVVFVPEGVRNIVKEEIPKIKKEWKKYKEYQNIENVNIKVGAQFMQAAPKGAVTGGSSMSWLDKGDFVLVGHSEDREIFKVTNEDTQKQVRAGLKMNEGIKEENKKIRIVLCCGETVEERKAGDFLEKVIRPQILAALEGVSKEEIENIDFAYEPVWAIKDKVPASNEQAQEVIGFIRGIIAEKYDDPKSADKVSEKERILYGGSVQIVNLEGLLNQKDIDGALIGGASLRGEKKTEEEHGLPFVELISIALKHIGIIVQPIVKVVTSVKNLTLAPKPKNEDFRAQAAIPVIAALTERFPTINTITFNNVIAPNQGKVLNVRDNIRAERAEKAKDGIEGVDFTINTNEVSLLDITFHSKEKVSKEAIIELFTEKIKNNELPGMKIDINKDSSNDTLANSEDSAMFALHQDNILISEDKNGSGYLVKIKLWYNYKKIEENNVDMAKYEQTINKINGSVKAVPPKNYKETAKNIVENLSVYESRRLDVLERDRSINPKKKVAINGALGRIGINVFREMLNRNDVELTAINVGKDKKNGEILRTLLMDSVHGNYLGNNKDNLETNLNAVSVNKENNIYSFGSFKLTFTDESGKTYLDNGKRYLNIEENGKVLAKILVSSIDNKNAGEIDLNGAEILIECTGDKELLTDNGVRKITENKTGASNGTVAFLSAANKDEGPMTVIGATDGNKIINSMIDAIESAQNKADKGKNPVSISNASCTTNSVAPMLTALNEILKKDKRIMRNAVLSTIHSLTNSQDIEDSTKNIVGLSETGAAKAVAKVANLENVDFQGVSVRVPAKNMSITALDFYVDGQITKEEINAYMEELVKEGPFKKIAWWYTGKILETDKIKRMAQTFMAMPEFTTVVNSADGKGSHVKIMLLYDNEFGYAMRLTELLDYYDEAKEEIASEKVANLYMDGEKFNRIFVINIDVEGKLKKGLEEALSSEKEKSVFMPVTELKNAKRYHVNSKEQVDGIIEGAGINEEIVFIISDESLIESTIELIKNSNEKHRGINVKMGVDAVSLDLEDKLSAEILKKACYYDETEGEFVFNHHKLSGDEKSCLRNWVHKTGVLDTVALFADIEDKLKAKEITGDEAKVVCKDIVRQIVASINDKTVFKKYEDTQIAGYKAKEIKDSRGNPTVWVLLTLGSGKRIWAAVPSGASTGSAEAYELRSEPGNNKSSVMPAINNVNEKIAPELIGMDLTDDRVVRTFDELMIKLDGSPNKHNLGANAILGVSLALVKAAAASNNVSEHEYWRKIFLQRAKEMDKETPGIGEKIQKHIDKYEGKWVFPVSIMNIFNGGAHGAKDENKKPLISIQEFMVSVVDAKTYPEAKEMYFNIQSRLGELLKENGILVDAKTGKISFGDEGGYAPKTVLKDAAQKDPNKVVLNLICQAIKELGYDGRVQLSLDAAMTDRIDEGEAKKGIYKYEIWPDNWLSSEEMIIYWENLVKEYPIIKSIEDPLNEKDWSAWTKLTEKIGDKVLLVGDDLFVTNIEFLKDGIKRKAGNAILVKVNQIGSASETIDTIIWAIANGYTPIISHRSGETLDASIAALALAVGAPIIKTGAFGQSLYRITEIMEKESLSFDEAFQKLELKEPGEGRERIAKYRYLRAAYDALGRDNVVYAGRDAFIIGAADSAEAEEDAGKTAIRLVLGRHGTTEYNATDRHTGWTDAELTEVGKEREPNYLAELLSGLGFRPGIIYTSILSRAMVTAENTLKAMGLSHLIDYADKAKAKDDKIFKLYWELNEKSYGNREGQTKAGTMNMYQQVWNLSIDTAAQMLYKFRRAFSIKDREPYLKSQAEIDDQKERYEPWIRGDKAYMLQNPLTEADLPWFEDGEDVVKRVGRFWEEGALPQMIKKRLENGGTLTDILMSASGNSLRALIMYLSELTPEQFEKLNIPMGRGIIILLDKTGKIIYQELNDEEREIYEEVFGEGVVKVPFKFLYKDAEDLTKLKKQILDVKNQGKENLNKAAPEAEKPDVATGAKISGDQNKSTSMTLSDLGTEVDLVYIGEGQTLPKAKRELLDKKTNRMTLYVALDKNRTVVKDKKTGEIDKKNSEAAEEVSMPDTREEGDLPVTVQVNKNAGIIYAASENDFDLIASNIEEIIQKANIVTEKVTLKTVITVAVTPFKGALKQLANLSIKDISPKTNELAFQKQILEEAKKGKYAIDVSDVTNMEEMQAVVNAAVETGSPAIVSINENLVDNEKFPYIVDMIKAAVKKHPYVKIAMHLSNGTDVEKIKKAIDLGFTSVGINSYSEELKDVVNYAHARGASVEVKMGVLDITRSDDPSLYDYASSLKDIGVDSLSLTITAENAAMYSEESMGVLKEISSLGLPLALDGNVIPVDTKLIEKVNTYGGKIAAVPGLSESFLQEAIKKGYVSKISIENSIGIAAVGETRESFFKPDMTIKTVMNAKNMTDEEYGELYYGQIRVALAKAQNYPKEIKKALEKGGNINPTEADIQKAFEALQKQEKYEKRYHKWAKEETFSKKSFVDESFKKVGKTLSVVAVSHIRKAFELAQTQAPNLTEEEVKEIDEQVKKALEAAVGVLELAYMQEINPELTAKNIQEIKEAIKVKKEVDPRAFLKLARKKMLGTAIQIKQDLGAWGRNYSYRAKSSNGMKKDYKKKDKNIEIVSKAQSQPEGKLVPGTQLLKEAMEHNRKIVDMTYMLPDEISKLEKEKEGLVYAIGAYNVNNLDQILAIVHAAKKTNSPVIIQLSKGALEYAEFEYVASLIKTAVRENPDMKIAMHLDHGETFEICKKAVDLGFSSVMVDGSKLSLEANIALTRRVVEYAHARGVSVEGELGEIGGVEDGVRGSAINVVKPEEVVRFIEETGIDSLAIGIGTSHGTQKSEPEQEIILQTELAKEIYRLSDEAGISRIPLVLHGASSAPQDVLEYAARGGTDTGDNAGVAMKQLRRSELYGITKINVDTDSRVVYTAVSREGLVKNPQATDLRAILDQTVGAMEKVLIEQKMGPAGFNTAGRGSDYEGVTVEDMKEVYQQTEKEPSDTRGSSYKAAMLPSANDNDIEKRIEALKGIIADLDTAQKMLVEITEDLRKANYPPAQVEYLLKILEPFAKEINEKFLGEESVEATQETVTKDYLIDYANGLAGRLEKHGITLSQPAPYDWEIKGIDNVSYSLEMPIGSELTEAILAKIRETGSKKGFTESLLPVGENKDRTKITFINNIEVLKDIETILDERELASQKTAVGKLTAEEKETLEKATSPVNIVAENGSFNEKGISELIEAAIAAFGSDWDEYAKEDFRITRMQAFRDRLYKEAIGEKPPVIKIKADDNGGNFVSIFSQGNESENYIVKLEDVVQWDAKQPKKTLTDVIVYFLDGGIGSSMQRTLLNMARRLFQSKYSKVLEKGDADAIKALGEQLKNGKFLEAVDTIDEYSAEMIKRYEDVLRLDDKSKEAAIDNLKKNLLVDEYFILAIKETNYETEYAKILKIRDNAEKEKATNKLRKDLADKYKFLLADKATKANDLFRIVIGQDGIPMIFNIMQLKLRNLLAEKGMYKSVAIAMLTVEDFEKLSNALFDEKIKDGKSARDLFDKVEVVSNEYMFPVIKIDDGEGKTPKAVRFVKYEKGISPLADEPAPGGHGLRAIAVMMKMMMDKTTKKVRKAITIIGNSDSIKSGPIAALTRWMRGERVSIVFPTTERQEIDLHGGVIGLREVEVPGMFEENGNPKKIKVLGIMEQADANTDEQKKLFEKFDGPFNLSMPFINNEMMIEIYEGLEKIYVSKGMKKADFATMFYGWMRAIPTINKRIKIELPMGTAFFKLNEQLEILRLQDPQGVGKFLDETLGKGKQLVRIVNIAKEDRDDYFTPTKDAVDNWKQVAGIPGTVIIKAVGFEKDKDGKVIIGDPAIGDQYKDAYYVLRYWTDTNGKKLAHLNIKGPNVKFNGVTLKGDVNITNKSTGDFLFGSQNAALAEYFSKDESGRLVIKDAVITMNEDGSVEVANLDGTLMLDKGLNLYTQMAVKSSYSNSFTKVFVGFFGRIIALAVETAKKQDVKTVDLDLVCLKSADDLPQDNAILDKKTNRLTFYVVVDNSAIQGIAPTGIKSDRGLPIGIDKSKGVIYVSDESDLNFVAENIAVILKNVYDINKDVSVVMNVEDAALTVNENGTITSPIGYSAEARNIVRALNDMLSRNVAIMLRGTSKEIDAQIVLMSQVNNKTITIPAEYYAKDPQKMKQTIEKLNENGISVIIEDNEGKYSSDGKLLKAAGFAGRVVTSQEGVTEYEDYLAEKSAEKLARNYITISDAAGLEKLQDNPDIRSNTMFFISGEALEAYAAKEGAFMRVFAGLDKVLNKLVAVIFDSKMDANLAKNFVYELPKTKVPNLSASKLEGLRNALSGEFNPKEVGVEQLIQLRKDLEIEKIPELAVFEGKIKKADINEIGKNSILFYYYQAIAQAAATKAAVYSKHPLGFADKNKERRADRNALVKISDDEKILVNKVVEEVGKHVDAKGMNVFATEKFIEELTSAIENIDRNALGEVIEGMDVKEELEGSFVKGGRLSEKLAAAAVFELLVAFAEKRVKPMEVVKSNTADIRATVAILTAA
ncbi:MAG: ketose-bisphosphate aldolase [Endomicrobia bacterium]|nr:ketose-bisphosphate aldolase [Endomicrobiia bacterium]